ncbi:MFS transporter [Gordonia sp. VNQ95]|uniref:MFS transporter n=1 Tax=Gordonia sp. VNQ95 TaxID=3156619 RepID=UPI0032B4992B
MATSRISPVAAWSVLVFAVAQAVAVFLPLLVFGGEPNDDGVDLFISPAGYAFAIWGIIYLLSIAVGIVFVRTRTSGTASPQRLAVDLAVACAAAATWLVVSAASLNWLPSILLTVLAVVLVDAALIAGRPVDSGETSATTTLVRITIGIYAAWATAATFVNWASDIARAGADATSVGWQLVLLIAAVLVGAVITYVVGSALPAYPLTLLWAFVAIVVTAIGSSTVVVVAGVIGMVVVIAAYAASVARRNLNGTDDRRRGPRATSDAGR